MKLIIAGSTGYVATELIRQALSHPTITSVVALGRREVPVPPKVISEVAGAAKFKSVICSDFENYSDDVKNELSGADACIWTIGITPSRSQLQPWERVVKVCRDYAVKGIETISQLPRSNTNTPFRFIFMSGVGVERNPAAKPRIFGDFMLMKGEAESRVLEYVQQSKGTVEACIAKPGLIGGQGVIAGTWLGVVKTIGRALSSNMPAIEVEEVAAAMLDRVVNGFDGKEDLVNDDLVRIGRAALEHQKRNEGK